MQDGIETQSVKRGRNAVAQKAGHCEEAIRDFHVADDQMPCTFRLLRVKELPPWANTSCVSISDVIQVVNDVYVDYFNLTYFVLAALS